MKLSQVFLGLNNVFNETVSFFFLFSKNLDICLDSILPCFCPFPGVLQGMRFIVPSCFYGHSLFMCEHPFSIHPCPASSYYFIFRCQDNYLILFFNTRIGFVNTGCKYRCAFNNKINRAFINNYAFCPIRKTSCPLKPGNKYPVHFFKFKTDRTHDSPVKYHFIHPVFIRGFIILMNMRKLSINSYLISLFSPFMELYIEYPRRSPRPALINTMGTSIIPVSYTHLRAHETRHDLVCRLLLEKKKKKKTIKKKKKKKNKNKKNKTQKKKKKIL